MFASEIAIKNSNIRKVANVSQHNLHYKETIEMALAVGCKYCLTSGPDRDRDSGLNYCGRVRQQQAGREQQSGMFPIYLIQF